MKILKIELQNINSLKSDKPTIIDFEDELFKDVGLFAITGSTGAGKTTILDAITIALYHNVPRFSSARLNLSIVVSHGAADAFSRVTFENENVIYEAFWGMRLTSKFGVPLANPPEEVSLKNITTGVIISTKKTDVKNEIIKITQLDYDQFLRSVLLAQGEFASFLTAKGPEKGTLLEQITGEQIYKKIGQGILDRKSKEYNKLRDIQSKINSDDILTDDQKNELAKRDAVLDVQIVASEKEIGSIQIVVNWYLKSKELTGEAEKIEEQSKEVTRDFENHKPEFELLNLNEKAEPFKELIQNFNRNEKVTIEKVNQLKGLDEQLALLKPQIDGLKELSEKQSAELVIANKAIEDWFPKFDQVTKLDGELKSEAENQLKSKKKLAELNLQIKSLESEKGKTTEDLTKTEAEIKLDEAFVTQNRFLTAVGIEISKWTTDLTTLNGNKETLNENSLFVSNKKKELEKATADLAENKGFLDKKLLENDKIDKEVEAIKEQLSKNNLPDLFAQKEKVAATESNWRQLKGLLEEFAKEEKELIGIRAKEKVFAKNLVAVIKEVEELKKQILIQEKFVVDAEKILDLEKSIAKYEDDRQNLIEGEPCGLCGSEEHPFTVNVDSVGVSKSEIELNSRKNKLKILLDSKSEFDKKESEFSTRIDGFKQQIPAISEELVTIQSKVKKLDVSNDLSNKSKIDIEINSSGEKLKSLDDKIDVAKKLQIKLDELLDTFKTQNQSVETLKLEAATLNEKMKNAKVEIETKQKSIGALTMICDGLEKELKEKLSKFSYVLPSIGNTNSFIQKIEGDITKYNKTQKDLDALKAETKLFLNTLVNLEKQLVAHIKTQCEFTKGIGDGETKSTQLKTERIAILPLEISVESKRESLKLISKQLSEKVESSKNELQVLLDSKTKNEALKVENTKEQTALKKELNTLQETLGLQLRDSDFEFKQDVERALLRIEDKQRYVKNKKRIEDLQLRLKTLNETHSKAVASLNISKNFETSEEESKMISEELKIKRDDLSTKKGEIKEAFRKDLEIQTRNKDTYRQIEAQEVICKVWKDLFEIIGNSKEAFNVYVQRLTLKHLLDLANVHLYNLNKRYSLQLNKDYKPKEELDFDLIDHYQTDQARLVDTSSGGEKFIISLALALGLSDLASKNVKIDSLFIDEGFGTLDMNTLETVISTLETLQSQGKKIGIISHVENLKERIPTQIQITKKSNGVSVVNLLRINV